MKFFNSSGEEIYINPLMECFWPIKANIICGHFSLPHVGKKKFQLMWKHWNLVTVTKIERRGKCGLWSTFTWQQHRLQFQENHTPIKL